MTGEAYVTEQEVGEIGFATRRIVVYANGYVRLGSGMVCLTVRGSYRWESATSIVPSTTGEDQWGGKMTRQEKYEVPKD